MSFALVLHAVILFVLLQTLTTILVNLVLFRRPNRHATRNADSPLVSILVPARDEEPRLPRCLDSLLAQDYANLEIIVLDDHSSDRTAEIAQARGFATETDARRRLMRGSDLPPGLTGK